MLIYIIITKEYVGIEFNTTTIILISIVGIVHTGISYLLYFSSLAHLDAQTIGLMSYIDPIIAIILSVCLLHEPLSILSIIGAVLVLGSTCVNELIQ